jgi:mRNA-degrading endonuclease RelE of RelBE toxin-antitoxin system
MARVKLIAESLNEWKDEKPVELHEELNEEQLNEGLLKKWEKLDKDDPEAIKAFAMKLGKDVQGDAGLKTIKSAIRKAKIDSLKKLLTKAAEDKFKGKLRPSGNSFVYRPAAERKVKSEFAGGGTKGKTQLGGV